MKAKAMHFYTLFPLLYVVLVNTILINTTNAFSTPIFIGNETDRLALLAIKSKITLDPHRFLESWNDSVNHCLWEGVTCGHRYQRVTELNLTAKDVVGTLSPFVGNLSFLHLLRLGNNTFRGFIPPQVGRLVKLQTLDLIYNEFEGSIPPNISSCLQLKELSLDDNKLFGQIPPELSLLSKLQILGLDTNNLTGNNLSPLSNLTSLKELSLSRQKEQGGSGFKGTIPEFIGNFKDLTILALGGNSFTGKIPPSLYNLSKLQILSLCENLLEGSLPPNIGSFFPQLQWLQIRTNKLSGPIPVSLSNLSNLEVIELGENNFTGKVLLNAQNMKNLTELHLKDANLGSGEADDLNFINTLVNCTHLQYLNIGMNNFGGVLPKSIVNLSTTLRIVVLDKNQITGSIPSGWSHYLNLDIITLSFNNFSGTIPPDIGRIPNLQQADFSNNQLSGSIPLSLGDLSWLSNLDLSSNKLQGTIPVTLGNCKSLQYLYFHQNNIVGNVPHQIFQASGLVEFSIYNNYLQGYLPPEIGNLKFLVKASMYNNNLSGNIPTTLGQCLSLTNLYLENNSFVGFVPTSFSLLKGILEIDLSSNKLSGPLPKFFSNISSLVLLNLSFNNFDGDVPIRGVFTNLSAISLVGNNKLCGGIPQLKLPNCLKTAESNKNRKLYAIVASTVASCALLGLASFCSIFLLLRRRKRKASPTSGIQFKEPFIRVSYDMLLKATNGFSEENLIGSGSYGSVYKGTLFLDGVEKIVAIKVIDNQRQGASKSFTAECRALRTIRHRNLVGIITACSSIDFRGNVFQALVYELMPNGSLERWLYSNPEEDDQISNLSLLQRLNIALDVAHSLDYLHNGDDNRFIHCDLKPTNILLDEDMVAHVGDFGLVKLLPEVSSSGSSTTIGVRGTVGYVAPEYGLGTSVSAAGDVYSYGIILLELMTARKPTDVMFEGGMSLRKFVESALPDRVLEVVDPKLRVDDCNDVYDDNEESYIINLNDTRGAVTKCAFECMTSIFMTGVRCSSELPQDRMDIKDAIHELSSQRDRLLLCKKHRCQRIL